MESKFKYIWNTLDPIWKNFQNREHVEAVWLLYAASLENLTTSLVQIDLNKNVQTLQPFHLTRNLQIVLSNPVDEGDDSLKSYYPHVYRLEGDDANIVFIKDLADLPDLPTQIYLYSTDFVVYKSLLYFKERPSFSTLYAALVYKDIHAIHQNYGALLHHRRPESSYDYLYEIQALWYAVWRAPTLNILRDAMTVLLGAPFAETETFVQKLTPLQISLENGRTFWIPAGTHAIVHKGQKVRRFQALTNAINVEDHTSDPFWWRLRNIESEQAPEKYFSKNAPTPHELNLAQTEDAAFRFHIFNVELRVEMSPDLVKKVELARAYLDKYKPTYTDYGIKVSVAFNSTYEQIPGDLPPWLGGEGGGDEIVVPPRNAPPTVTPGVTAIFDRVPILDLALNLRASTQDIAVKYLRACTRDKFARTNTTARTNNFTRKTSTVSVEVSPERHDQVLVSAARREQLLVPPFFVTNRNFKTNAKSKLKTVSVTVPEQVISPEVVVTFRSIRPRQNKKFTANNPAWRTNDMSNYEMVVSEKVIAPREVRPEHIISKTIVVTEDSRTNVGKFILAYYPEIWKTVVTPAVYEERSVISFVPRDAVKTCDMEFDTVKRSHLDTLKTDYSVTHTTDLHQVFFDRPYRRSFTNTSGRTNTSFFTAPGQILSVGKMQDTLTDPQDRFFSSIASETRATDYVEDRHVNKAFLDFVGESARTNDQKTRTNGKTRAGTKEHRVKKQERLTETVTRIERKVVGGRRTNFDLYTNDAIRGSLTNPPVQTTINQVLIEIELQPELWETRLEPIWIPVPSKKTANFYCRNVDRKERVTIIPFDEIKTVDFEPPWLRWTYAQQKSRTNLSRTFNPPSAGSPPEKPFLQTAGQLRSTIEQRSQDFVTISEEKSYPLKKENWHITPITLTNSLLYKTNKNFFTRGKSSTKWKDSFIDVGVPKNIDGRSFQDHPILQFDGGVFAQPSVTGIDGAGF